MKQLSVRGFDPQLSEAIKTLAREQGLSLNQAALRLMRLGAGLTEQTPRRKTIGHTMDVFVGSMTDREGEQLLESLEPCNQIDESFWE